MRITRIEIDGFSCLREFQVDLAPGLHAFHGPNESGKSTLQQSIFALLYGFYETDRARAAENEARERSVPWSGPPYKGRLEYELQNGPRYRVERDFSSSDLPTTLWDLEVGRDVTDEFGGGRHGNVPFARQHIGMSRNVFDACAFVSQGELLEIVRESRTPQEIGDTIIALADTARRDISAQSAIEHLDNVLRNRVGGPRARTAPLPATRSHFEQAKRELEDIDRVRADLADDAASLERAMEEASELRDEISRTRYLILQAEIAKLENRLKQLDGLNDEDENLHREVDANRGLAGFPADERDEVLQRWGRIVDLRESVSRDRSGTDKKRHRLQDLSGRRESVARRERALAYLRDYPADRQDAIEGLANTWRSLRAVQVEAEKRRRSAEVDQEIVTEYQRLEPEVTNLTRDYLERLTRRLRAAEEIWLQRASRSVIRAIVTVLRWVWVRIVTTSRRALEKLTGRPTEVRSEDEGERAEQEGPILPDSLSPDEATAILQRHRRFLEVAPIAKRYLEEKNAAETARSNAEGAAQELREALEGLVEDASDPDRAYRTFIERVDEHREIKSLASQLRSLDGELSSLQEAIDRFERDQEKLGRLESGLVEELRRNTGARGSLEALIEAFEEGCRRRGAYDDAKKRLLANDERRGTILQGNSPGELEDALRKMRTEAERLRQDSPSLEGARSNESLEDLEALLSRRRADLHRSEMQTTGLRTAIDTKLAQLRPRAEVEEELERYKGQISVLERFGSELIVAREAIGQAMTEAHRNFAPSVGRFLSQGLARVTGNRYQQVLLDPSSLRLTTEVPETRRFEDVELLSRGTRAAAYLLLRVGLAQHMSSMGEPVPLILDDPLVDLDDVRVENLLDLLLELSSEVQILLFSKDSGTRAWFERRCSDSARNRMTLLPAPGL